MTINKFIGKNEEEAKAKARQELGSSAVIMNIKEIKPRGLAGLFKSSTYEVTAAIEDDIPTKEASIPSGLDSLKRNANSDNSQTSTSQMSKQISSSTFEAVADDDFDILKDAFSAVDKVLEKQEVSNSNEKKESNTDKEKISSENKFSPLADAVPKAHIVSEPTYSKPQQVPKQSANYSNKNEDASSINSITDSSPASMYTNRVADFSKKPAVDNENHMFVKMLYNVLLDNEVQEKYINSVLEDMDKVLRTSHSIDNLLSSVYQKMVLKLGSPKVIKSGDRRPKVIYFIGPTGVGKTTTIAKIASKFKVEEGKKVALITADTFRMAAANQLQTYANILGVALNVVYSADELLDTVKKQSREIDDLDVILVDTIGFSHKNEEQREDTQKLLNSLNGIYDSEVYLVLSATTKYKDLVDIVDSYSSFTSYNLIFTKLDETRTLGNIYNTKIYSQAPLSYVTYGQNVPDDIEVVNAQKLVKQLLGGN